MTVEVLSLETLSITQIRLSFPSLSAVLWMEFIMHYRLWFAPRLSSGLSDTMENQNIITNL